MYIGDEFWPKYLMFYIIMKDLIGSFSIESDMLLFYQNRHISLILIEDNI